MKKKFEYKKGDHLFLCGKTGTGKSYALVKLIQNILKDNFIIFDTKKEDFKKLGAEVVHNYKQFLLALKSKKTKILVQDSNLDIPRLDKYCKFLYYNAKNFTIIVDELHEYVTKHKIAPHMKKILHIGRSSGKAFWGASQRTADIHNSVMSQTIHKFSFYLGLVGDRDRMEKELDLKEYGKTFKDLNVEKHDCFYKYDLGNNPVEITHF